MRSNNPAGLLRANGQQCVQGNEDLTSELSDVSSNVASSEWSGSEELPTEPDNSVRTEIEVLPQTPEGSTSSYRPKRRRTCLSNSLDKSNLESPYSEVPATPSSHTTANKLDSQSITRAKGVLLGIWRDSDVPSNDKKHAVIGFIDKRYRLRLRIQPNTKYGESLTEQYPLPPGPGRCWVTFERVIFSDHLVGLDQFQVKEYTRIRSEAVPEETEGERVAAEHAAVQEAIRCAKENRAPGNPVQPLAVAYGALAAEPSHSHDPVHPELKRSRVSAGFAAIDPASPEVAPEPTAIPSPQQSFAAHRTRSST
ncbi:hypothetical protein X797_012320, partial [Metarhizium robertsii]